MATCLIVLSSHAFAGDADGRDATTEDAKQNRGYVTLFFPAADFYPQYIADPLSPQCALMRGTKSSTEIQGGDTFYLLRLGGRFPIVRWHRAENPEQGWQLDFEGGFFGQFNIDNNLDNTGWDGLFGLTIVYHGDGPLSFRVGTRHDSAHVGDEYAERTGRRRIDYTRAEYVAAVSWQIDARWRTYAEGGYAFDIEEFQEPLRLQLGVEYLSARRFWNSRFGWYVAVDTSLFEERGWRVNATAQLGLVYPTGRGSSRFRLGMEGATGRAALGEFSFHDETYIALGWYYDY